jgi:hypothetical protein
MDNGDIRYISGTIPSFLPRSRAFAKKRVNRGVLLPLSIFLSIRETLLAGGHVADGIMELLEVPLATDDQRRDNNYRNNVDPVADRKRKYLYDAITGI